MGNSHMLSKEERERLEQTGVDVDLSLSILDDYNKGRIGRTAPVVPLGVPDIDGKTIIDLRSAESIPFSEEELAGFRKSYQEASAFLYDEDGLVSKENLAKTGTALLPFFSYGFLNGGSATSYGDIKKNRGFNPELFQLYKREFSELAELSRDRPKGVTPGFLQPDGSPGPSYMELKLRSLLLLMKSYRELTGNAETGGIPFFQMTSVSNDPSVQQALVQYRNSPWLKDLASSLMLDSWTGYTAVQPLITAYSHSSEGSVKQIYRNDSRENPFIMLPGGHGQCFRVLRESWQKLYEQGIRFISLGNIDNLGYTLDPVELAILAIRNSPAGFDESYKTAVDIKGGILVNIENNRLTCVDLGVGISHEEAAKLESSGSKILFNCGSGLFNLKWLLDSIDTIISDLPLRFSDQSKDAGEYSQAEQVTWEVISMIDKPLIFAVDKYKRFLAAKILLENMMTSGLRLDDPLFPSSGSDKDLRDTAGKLSDGLKILLETKYGLILKNNLWVPEELNHKG